ncbi:hypothetical protein [Blastococcus brunescens]|uniref:SsuA/THI5-like domain-containing protein n=1 Tax=Blastococcus brunescens TaxID=1564165 RepID=A0ABZ1B030_9ACTN|nr:hypothetical protein [Blastococcus sp. BMG 8361]WRL64167.1 hypothetical protein U6N30_32180 [Blastococcus sp. BMG 8361]
MKRSLRAKAAMSMAAALCTLSVAACGGSSDEEGTPAAGGGGDGAPETTELTVGVQPFAEVAALYVAVEEGLFDEEGLTVTPQVGAGGVPASSPAWCPGT